MRPLARASMYTRARLRLTAWYSGAFLLVLLLLGGGTYAGLVWALDREVDRGIRAAVEDWMATAPPVASLRPIDLESHEDGGRADVFLVVFRADGALVANPRGVRAEELLEEGVLAPAFAGREQWTTLSEDGERLRLLAVPLTQRGVVTGVVVGGRSLETRDESVRATVMVLGGVAGGGLVMAVGAGYVLAGRALAPLREAYERQRAFIGDASHELRAPITLVRALAELLQRGPLAPDQRQTTEELVAVADEARSLIDELLVLARASEAAQPSAGGPTDLAAAAGAVIDRLTPLIEAHESRVERDLAPALASVPEADAARVVRALLENVVAHTPRGTRVLVRTFRRGRTAVLTVADDGPGVPPAHYRRIFERFAQVEEARTPGEGRGAGLGLAIVDAIAVRRGGSATARASAWGGLEVEVVFPAA